MTSGNIFRRLLSDEAGSVAVTFALALVPALLAVGVGVDFARGTAERDRLQQGVDASVLAGIQAVRKGETLAQARVLIGQVIGVNDPSDNVSVTSVTMSSDDTVLCVTAKSSVATTIMGIAGFSTIPVGAKACSKMNLDTYEIAIAIDNSNSMLDPSSSGGSQTKMQAAQQAAKGMISVLTGNGSGNAVKASFSLVPFASSVNVGASYATANASWLDLDGQSSIHWNSFTYLPPVHPASLFDVYNTIGIKWAGCVQERPSPYTTSDTIPASSNPDTLFAPFFWPDETDNNPNGNGQTYNNYTGDSSGSCKPNDVYAQADANAPGRGDGQTKFCKYTSKVQLNGNTYSWTGEPSSPNTGCKVTALTPLNATGSVVSDAIDAMTPKGDTSLAPGFLWAWRTISPKGPFRNDGAAWSSSGQQKPKPYNYVDPSNMAVNHKVIILLTDGMNYWLGQPGVGSKKDPNVLTYGVFGWAAEGRLGTTTSSNARSLLDQTTLSACNAAKAATDSSGNPAPVEIFTVGFLASGFIDAPGKALLKSCATQDNKHSFIAANGDQLVQVFQQIAAQIVQPRLSY